jgi:hypothetical protein
MFAPFTKSVAPAGSVVTSSFACAPPPPAVAHAAEPKAATAKQTHSNGPFTPYSCVGMP